MEPKINSTDASPSIDSLRRLMRKAERQRLRGVFTPNQSEHPNRKQRRAEKANRKVPQPKRVPGSRLRVVKTNGKSPIITDGWGPFIIDDPLCPGRNGVE